MIKKSVVLFFGLILSVISLDAQEWSLVWMDEFDGIELDQSKWAFQTGTGVEYGIPDWGNNEQQYYQEENAVVADGMLTITAKKEGVGGKPYTSARIRTKDKADWKYCRVEFRTKMPLGKGLWAAVWMLSSYDAYGGWAASGEIDIMEYLGHEPSKVHGTLHFGDEWPQNQHKGTHFTLASGDFHSDFHDFAFEWEEGEMRWYVDGELYQELGIGDWWTTGYDFPAPFNRPFHLLVNLAVGGNWPGNPDGTTQFPQDMVIDYIKVYEKFPVGVSQGEQGNEHQIRLEQNYPNPAGKETRFLFNLSAPLHVVLDVYDITGRKVDELITSLMQEGHHHLTYDLSELSPGIYSYRFKADNYVAVKKMQVL